MRYSAPTLRSAPALLPAFDKNCRAKFAEIVAALRAMCADGRIYRADVDVQGLGPEEFPGKRIFLPNRLIGTAC